MNVAKLHEKPENTDTTKPEKPRRTTIGVQFTDEIVQSMKEFCYDDDRPFGYMVRVACTEYIAKRRAAKQQAREAEKAAKTTPGNKS